MKLNNKGQGQLLIMVLVVGILFGGVGRGFLSKINPFKAKTVAVQKDQGVKEEYFKDKIKGIEYRYKETHKSQNTQPATSGTLGQRIGNFIDSSIRLIIGFIIFGIILLFLTGINIFKYVKRILIELNAHRRALKQTIKAVDSAKPKLNGEDKTLKAELAKFQDEETKILINKIKNR